MDNDYLRRKFSILFGEGEPALFFSPGRVNLIGEHIDYNGGKVLPCAISMGIYGAAKKNGQDYFALYSENFSNNGIIIVPISNFEKTGTWADYPLGVFSLIQKKCKKSLCGMDILIEGDLPDGAGLSSSASLEVLACVIAKELCSFIVDDVPGLCREAESVFNGVNCGIMDQFAVYMGKRDMSICLDTQSMCYEYVPLSLRDKSLVICSSNKKRTLADSKYNTRRVECELALADIQKVKHISSLCELSPYEFERLKGVINSKTTLKRAKHAIYENYRTERAVEALKCGNIELFGNLMYESHASLRDDFEVTGKELDTLVSLALNTSGVLGSRMTGAGFGGCTVSIVRNNILEAFENNIKNGYYDAFSYYPDVYIAKSSNGAGLWEEVL